MQQNILFNDVYYDRAKKYVINEITQYEADAFQKQYIRKIYGSFDELLLDNITHYSRIIRTILWLYENVLVNDGKIIMTYDKVKYSIPMTPTKFYYMCLIDTNSNKHEILYAYPQLTDSKKKTKLGDFYNELKSIGAFSFNTAFASERTNSNSYQYAIDNDTTNNAYLHAITSNKSYVHINATAIKPDIQHIVNICSMMQSNYDDFLKYMKQKMIIVSSPQRIILTSNQINIDISCISGNVIKDMTGKIDVISSYDKRISRHIDSVYENFVACETLVNKLDNFRIIASILLHSLKQNFTAIRSFGDNTHGIIRIKRFWNNYKIYETHYKNNKVFQQKTFNIGKIDHVINYLIDNGYFIYAHINDIDSLWDMIMIDDPQLLFNHYENVISTTTINSNQLLSLFKYETQRIVSYMSQNHV